jgi:hypothetical protein
MEVAVAFRSIKADSAGKEIQKWVSAKDVTELASARSVTVKAEKKGCSPNPFVQNVVVQETAQFAKARVELSELRTWQKP